jgi:hypothetical protein
MAAELTSQREYLSTAQFARQHFTDLHRPHTFLGPASQLAMGSQRSQQPSFMASTESRTVTPVNSSDLEVAQKLNEKSPNLLEAVELAAVPGGGDDSDLPEGGTRAWLAVFGAWLVQFANYGYTNSYGVYNDYYVREYLTEHSSFDTSWIGSVQLAVSLFAGVFTGRAFDAGYLYVGLASRLQARPSDSNLIKTPVALAVCI